MDRTKYFETFLSRNLNNYNSGDYSNLANKLRSDKLTKVEHQRFNTYVNKIETNIPLREYESLPNFVKIDFASLVREVNGYNFHKTG